MNLADLRQRSIPRSALIADLLHRIGFTEKAATGMPRIRDNARASNCSEPEFEASRFMTASIQGNPEVPIEWDDHNVGEVTPAVSGQITGQETWLLHTLSGDLTRQGMQEAPGLKHHYHLNDFYLFPALRAGLIDMTIPDKLRGSRQRYRLTPAGSEYLKQIGEAR